MFTDDELKIPVEEEEESHGFGAEDSFEDFSADHDLFAEEDEILGVVPSPEEVLGDEI